ncbi:MAG: hypothetical protein ACT4QA_05605 [Panacagrimonas sp.]
MNCQLQSWKCSPGAGSLALIPASCTDQRAIPVSEGAPPVTITTMARNRPGIILNDARLFPGWNGPNDRHNSEIETPYRRVTQHALT